jgi:hypothetical protein
MFRIVQFRDFITAIMLAFCACQLSVKAQDVKVRAEIDANQIKIGKQANIYLKATAPKGIAVVFPEFKDTITSKIEHVSTGKTDTLNSGSEVTYQRKLVITAFDSGYFPIPPFVFKLKNDSSKKFETEALLIAVQTVPVDTTLAIKAIKGPIDPAWSIFEIQNEILIGLLILIAMGLLIYFFRKRKKVEVQTAVPEIIKPAHEIALESLSQIKAQKLWQQGQVKEYHIAVSDTVRVYIEKRYAINAMEMTSDEILRSLRLIITDNSIKSKLSALLILSDMVKFAKEQPLPNENEMCWEQAVDFVKQTAILDVKEEVKS